MPSASREFQIFAKPVGPACNLACSYCYYMAKEHLYPKGVVESFRMSDELLEEYIVQHIEAWPVEVEAIGFSWHGGEPTAAGLDFFRRAVELQEKHRPSGRRIVNGIQTNGLLIDDDWGSFLADHNFAVGISLDGPWELHDPYRTAPNGKPSHHRAVRGYKLLRRHGIEPDILCVVHDRNVRHPSEVYRFFKDIGAVYISFLPLVERVPGSDSGVSDRTVPAEAFGIFLRSIFDEWLDADIGRIKVEIFEEAAAAALGREQTVCIFRETCGDVPVLERNGDFYSCDHFVDVEHRLGNIHDTPLAELIESPEQRAFGRAKLNTLPRYCRECEVRETCNGECPKNRFIRTPDGKGEEGLNYLCAGYRSFFDHCRPFVEELAVLREGDESEVGSTQSAEPARVGPRTGRNDPCPCGSGLKYKHCCLDK